MNKGMLPLALAFDVEKDVYDFLDVFFEIKGNAAGEELRKYYRETSPIVKGPFIKVTLPYKTCSTQDENPLDLKTEHLPYIHQINAFKRLHHSNPQNTIITTGTGSGKTECFMYPFLDYVAKLKKKGAGEGALKAVILYPMNALLDDQAIRFCKAIKEHNLEDLGIRVGKYTGDNGTQKTMDLRAFKVIDNRDELCKNPPDILLTNYKMLDYMLFREKEKTFWNKKTAQYLKYLVLDEMHTFDGASGADVACLIRRLKQVAYGDIETVNSKLTCIGTSATLSSDPNAKNELINFANNLFGSNFDDRCIIEETRHSITTYLGEPVLSINSVPVNFKKENYTSSSTSYKHGDSLEKYVSMLLSTFELDGYLSKKSKLSIELRRNDILQYIVKICSSETRDFVELVDLVKEVFPEHLNIMGEEGLRGYIIGLLALSSFARNESRDSAPFLTIKCSLWAIELKRLLKKVASSTDKLDEFIDDTVEIDSSSLYLPAVYCSYCGENGWYTKLEGNSDNMRRVFNSNLISLRTMWTRNEGSVLFPVSDNTRNNEVHYLYPGSKTIFREEQGVDEDYPKELGTPIPVIEATVREGRCPCCDSKLKVRPFSIGGSSLTSLISSSMFTHPLNGDKKAISFSDSVQDASHQASFLNNRSYTFYFRRTISKSLTEGRTLGEIQADVFNKYNFSEMTAPERVNFVGKFIPDKLKKKWQLLSNNSENRNYPDKILNEVKDYVDYSVFCEFTTNSKLGWTFEKVGHGGLFIDQSTWNKLLSASRNIWIEQDEKLKPFNDDIQFSQFLYALVQRWKSHGVMYSPFLEGYYNDKKASPYPFIKKYPNLMSATFNIPRFFSPVGGSGVKEYEALGGTQSWYFKYFQKYSSSVRVLSFFQDLSEWLNDNGLLKVVGEEYSALDKKRYVLSDSCFKFTQKIEVYQCDKCYSKTSVPFYLDLIYKGAHCQQRFCNGKYIKKNKELIVDYFQHYFSLDGIRINAHEHTGLLDPKIKSVVENEFKKGKSETPFHDINFLSCTPTMEMGIDIGNLSSVILKSVPKNAASFVQRVGRSGRTTGNSLDVLVIEKNPHNLYFWDEPKSLLNWEVTPPSCRYLTEHILQRQFNAYCLDQFLHRGSDEYEKKMPTSFSWIEKEDLKSSKYWEDFNKFFKDTSESLFQNFSILFNLREEVSVQSELKKYVDENGPLESFRRVFDEIESEIKFIDHTIGQLSSEIIQLAEKDLSFLQSLDEQVENPQKDAPVEVLSGFDESVQDTILELHSRIKSLKRKKASLLDPRKSNPLAIFADRGVLPGYAFPEQGTELELNIRRPLENKTITSNPYHTISISRPAEMALRELAPFNTFYTHGYKAVVDRLGIYGNRTPFHSMGRCPSCSNITSSICCENCGHDVELHDAYELKKAISSTSFQKSYVSDSSEKRNSERYKITRSFLFDKHDKKISKKIISYFNKKSRFGYEFQTNVGIISTNYGHCRISDNVEIFEVCENCGAVRDRSREKQRQVQSLPTVNHYKSCLDKDPKMKEVTLFREIRSDAVRIPCPHPAFAPTLESLLSLATRIHLRGDVGHIRIDSYDQPQFESNSFVVLFDNVPGGTGHLRDLFGISLDLNSDHMLSPQKFISIFSSVLEHLEKCLCKDGCYKCLWGTHNSFHRESISKRTAIAWLKSIKGQSVDDYQRLDNTLFDIAKEHAFDGQTEVLFFNCLTSLSRKITTSSYAFQIKNAHTEELDVSRWEISRGDKHIILESSPTRIVELKGCPVPYTKPDFTIYDKNNNAVAYIYTDGAKYHINPGEVESTLETDITIRNHLSKEKKVPVITLTYSDLAVLWSIIQEDDINNLDILKINPYFFDEISTDFTSLKHEVASQQLKIVLRLFNILLGDEKEISELEVIASFQPWIMRQQTRFLTMSIQDRSFSISTTLQLRTEEDDYGHHIPDDYYAAWVTYWTAFNYANLSSMLRTQINFSSKR